MSLQSKLLSIALLKSKETLRLCNILIDIRNGKAFNPVVSKLVFQNKNIGVLKIYNHSQGHILSHPLEGAALTLILFIKKNVQVFSI